MYEIDRAEVETDEDGFVLVLTHRDTDTPMRFNVQDCAEQLYDTVTGMIGPWLAEKEAARRTMPAGFFCDPDESGGLRDHAFRTAEIVASLYDQEKDR